jgi:hypothetical protein
MIIPDVQLNLNGHAVIAFTYNIYLDCGKGDPTQRLEKDLATKDDKLEDPDYFGYIIFHKADSIFTYVSDGENRLSEIEVEQLIDKIIHVRNRPDLWQKFNDN